MYDPRELLPQEPPMLVISSILSYDSDSSTIVTEMDVSENCFYFDKIKRVVPSLFGIEYIAQTAGCLAGIEDNTENKIDLILSVKSYSAFSPFFYKNKSYRVQVIKKEKIEGLFKVKGIIIDQNDKIICESEIKIYRKSFV